MEYIKLGNTDLDISRICMGSVSYTHLDVYKRQGKNRGMRKVSRDMLILNGMQQTGK